MSKRKARFKKLEDDSKILGVGTLFRGQGRKSWAINVALSGKNPNSLQFSNVPIIARRRILNPTVYHRPAGRLLEFDIEDAQAWEVAKASDCPAFYTLGHSNDGDQLCFVIQVENVQVFIPQLEMARALFYHDPFLARLSLQHNALAEDFFLDYRKDGQPLVVVREGAEYPIFYFNCEDNRRFLSWVLLDSEARASFESINVLLTKNSYLKSNYQHWNYEFVPPPLTGVSIEVRGWEEKNLGSFFVWEVSKLESLPSDVSGEIDFYHPGYERRVGGRPTKGNGGNNPPLDEHDLDDDELSDSDKATLALISGQVTVTFKNPHVTNRVAKRIKSVNGAVGDNETEDSGKDLSPNEKEESGTLPSGAWNNLDDQTDDTHLYMSKFDSFFRVIDSLISKHDCKKVGFKLLKLPKVGEGKKHRLSDTQNPRCMAIVELEHCGQFFTLLEIDTSDGAAKLSTMLLSSASGWALNNKKSLLLRIMKKSLGWPTDFFKEKLGEKAYSGIPHPKSKHSGVLPPEVIEPWAQRIANWIERSA
ncbi:Tn7-like element transposition protein TnsE [Pseudoteredinibacter isoporae]|uniref:Tn7-like element transposition protein TnsE n=1 Tax=Pseudoteredinibacter isoporae TaxID=570281 RepID=UPI0031071110